MSEGQKRFIVLGPPQPISNLRELWERGPIGTSDPDWNYFKQHQNNLKELRKKTVGL